MFENCINLILTPTLLATELLRDCYKYMFSGCSKVNEIKCNAIQNTSGTDYWLYNTSSTGTFYKNPNATITDTWEYRSPNGIPRGWEVKDYVE